MESSKAPDIRRIVAEKLKRQANIPNVLDGSFKEQIDFINHPSRRKVLLCARRAGKSTGAGLALIKTGLENPNCTMSYVSMTLKTTKDIMYKNVFEFFDQKYNLNLKMNTHPPIIYFPNGSVINFVGIDSKENEKNKLLGQKNKLVVIDEAQDITVDVEDLINRVMKYTLIDTQGSIIMLGTPSDNMSTYFYKLTQNYKSEHGWDYFSWHPTCNTSFMPGVGKTMAQLYLEDIEKEKEKTPFIETTASFKQMYLGLWVANKGALVYRWSENNFRDTSPEMIKLAKEKDPEYQLKDLPVIDEVPDKDINGRPIEYITNLGIDIGFYDADAFIIIKYSLHDPILYVVEAHIQTRNDDLATGYIIQRLKQRFAFNRMIIDGSNSKSVETMRQRMGIPLENADKGTKSDYIGMFNTDMDAGLIKIFPQPKKVLLNEWQKLIWDPDPRKSRRELPGLENHVSDALLYVWRMSRNWSYTELKKDVVNEDDDYRQRHNIMHGGVFDYLINKKDEDWNFR